MKPRCVRWTIFIILGLIFPSLAGCSGKTYQTQTDRYVVGVVTKSKSSEYWMSVQSGMEAAASEYGMEILFMAPDSELQEDVQEKLVETLLEQGVDALAISPIDSYQEPDYLEKIQKLGVTTVAFDTGFEGQDFPYVGIDNEQIGYDLAECLAEELGHTGEVGIVSGSLDQMGHRERVEGFQRYMVQEENMTVVFVESGYSNLQMSESKVQALLSQYPDVDGIFATSAVTALGLSDETAGSGIKIVTVDEQQDSVEALEEGALCALGMQSGYDIGYETIRLLQDIRTGEDEGQDRLLDCEILTQDTLRNTE